MSGNPERSALWNEAFALIRDRGYERREEPFRLASGESSHDYIDGKYAIDTGPRLRLMSEAFVEITRDNGWDFDAVGGLTMGADALAIGIAMVAECHWFSVRKESKERGRKQLVEGSRLTAQNRVLLVDDVVTSGGSIKVAYDRVRETGATVVGAITLVARSDAGAKMFAELGVPYQPLASYRDLGIVAVGQ